jgi:hypothetical protein
MPILVDRGVSRILRKTSTAPIVKNVISIKVLYALIKAATPLS